MKTFPSDHPVFHDEHAARAAVEALRWPDGPVCPHCHAKAQSFEIGGEKKSHRAGLRHCRECRRQFTATVGTALERTRVSFVNWIRLAYVLSRTNSRNVGVPEVAEALDVPYKTAARMLERVADTLVTYKGLLDKRRFGPPATEFVVKARGSQPRLRFPKHPSNAKHRANVGQRYLRWKERLKLDASATPIPTGVLRSKDKTSVSQGDLDRVERLLMVVLNADQAETNAARKKRSGWDWHRSRFQRVRIRLPNGASARKRLTSSKFSSRDAEP
ncbi:transposase [Bradyrhizobium sp. NBAIM14]|nr:transposase [Bradyrhizobium sp. NBAIM14]